ncbi:isoprenylcysteine carboxylmethyltransferase family protein [Candidatus Parcubacteria bacterium]|nr:MAG: isoprenylcysteine carboxylmethyltransferase family protein [Candidatus Parcubacteria bacterium]
MSENRFPSILVGVQLLAILLIILTGSLTAKHPILFVLELFGIFLFLWAFFTFKKISKLSVSPEPADKAHLVTSGPYKLIRHPMYSSILITMATLVIDIFTVERFILYIILFIDLIIKLNFEEKLLKQKFKNYSFYKKRTYRLIPFIY